MCITITKAPEGKTMWQKIAEKAANSFWRDLGVDLFKSAVSTAVVETARSHVIMWRDMKLKRKRRALDLIYRSEDDVYRDRREAEKKAREEAEKAKKEQEKKQEETREEILNPALDSPDSSDQKEDSPASASPEDGTLGLFTHKCEG